MSAKKKINQILLTIILLLVGFVVIFPFIWMIGTSFKSGAEVYSMNLLPKHFSLENYITDFPFRQAAAWRCFAEMSHPTRMW